MPFSCAVYLTLRSLLLPPHLNGAIKLTSARVSSRLLSCCGRSMRKHRAQKSGENVNGRFGPADALRHSGRTSTLGSPQSAPVKPVRVSRRGQPTRVQYTNGRRRYRALSMCARYEVSKESTRSSALMRAR